MVRAKFFVQSVKNHAYQQQAAKKYVTVELVPVQGDTEENKRFWHATPNGRIEMMITSDAAESFIVGTQVYADFTPAE